MMRLALALALLVQCAGTYLGGAARPSHPRGRRAACVHRRLRAADLCMAAVGGVVITDGSGSFYGSRTLFQALHDHGEDVGKIVAFSSSTSDAKKMLLSRNARYSGLIEKLEFAEGGDGEMATALGEATTWVAMNADGASLASQLSAAAAGGVKRVFIHLSAASADDAPDVGAITAACGSMEYTVMRTGALGKGGSGGGLLLGEVDQPVCDEVCACAAPIARRAPWSRAGAMTAPEP